jgi:hypothetical protein
MPEAAVFEVRSKGCGGHLMTVERLRDPEIAALVDHLRPRSPSGNRSETRESWAAPCAAFAS